MTLFKKKTRALAKVDALRLIEDETPFAVKEAFRTLYTKVRYLPIQDKCRKIAITSSIPGEGKTYISINLAITLAKSADKKRILLVDLDMRKPRILKLMSKLFQFHLSNATSGLSEYLAGIDEKPNIIPTDIPNFSILFSGKESENSIGLVNSARMTELLASLESEYDYIIIDTPPVSVVSDALIIADKINGFILSSRADYSDVNNLANAIESIESVGGEIFGVVLTAVNPKLLEGSQKRYGYSNYYYISNQEEI